MTAISPRKHDEREAAMRDELGRATGKLHSLADRVHRAAGDRKLDRWTRRERWALTIERVLATVGEMAAALDPEAPVYGSDHPVNLLKSYQETADLAGSLREGIAKSDAVYRKHLWSRFILCLSQGGHIHNYLGCSTLRPTSLLQWHPEFSGLTEAQAVNGTGVIKGLGPILCTHCFPSAPAEYRQNPADVGRAARDAAKAEREAQKLIKNLRKEEQFRDHHGSWVTTVAGCKQALRDERELFYYYGSGPHSWHPEAARAAGMATQVLLDRETAQPGTGATQAEIDQIVTRADKKQRAA